MANYQTYDDICDIVAQAMGDNNQVDLNLIKSAVNMVYLLEIPRADDLNPCLWFLRFLDDSLKCKDSKSITSISKANPAVLTATAHGLVNGDIIQSAGVSGMTEANNRVFVFTKTSVDAGTLATLDGTAWDTSGLSSVGTGGTLYHRGITLATGQRQVLSAAWHGYSGEITPIDEVELEKITSYWDPGNSGRPSRYLVKKFYTSAGAEATRLLWFPLPDDNYQLRYWYEKHLDRLSATTDVPVLPYEYHDMLSSGAIVRLAKYPDVQVYNAISWPSIYKGQLSALVSENREWWRKFNKDNRSGLFLP